MPLRNPRRPIRRGIRRGIPRGWNRRGRSPHAPGTSEYINRVTKCFSVLGRIAPCGAGRSENYNPLPVICRLRPSFDPYRQETVCQGRLRNRPSAGRLRIRFHYHRSLPFVVSMGAISQTQGRRQSAHSDRPARQYPLLYQHHRRKNPRRQHPCLTMVRPTLLA